MLKRTNNKIYTTCVILFIFIALLFCTNKLSVKIERIADKNLTALSEPLEYSMQDKKIERITLANPDLYNVYEIQRAVVYPDGKLFIEYTAPIGATFYNHEMWTSIDKTALVIRYKR